MKIQELDDALAPREPAEPAPALPLSLPLPLPHDGHRVVVPLDAATLCLLQLDRKEPT
jgi:hypothetical protein